MTCFIHTADWQIGKPYLQIGDDQKRFKLQQERLNVIHRIRDNAHLKKSNFVATFLVKLCQLSLPLNPTEAVWPDG